MLGKLLGFKYVTSFLAIENVQIYVLSVFNTPKQIPLHAQSIDFNISEPREFFYSEDGGSKLLRDGGTRRHIPEGSMRNLYIYRRENLHFHTVYRFM
jgi:hypothetical protein